MLTLGSDLDNFRASLRSGLERMLNIQARAPSRPARYRAAEPPARHPGGGAAAGRGGARDHHQRRQSVARRTHREGFGPAAPSAIRSVGHAISGLCAGADRRRGRGLVSVRHRRHLGRRARREPVDGLRDPWLCRAAHDHPRHGQPAVHARQHLRRRPDLRLAGAGDVAVGPCRYRLRFARPRRPQARHHPILKLKTGERPWK